MIVVLRAFVVAAVLVAPAYIVVEPVVEIMVLPPYVPYMIS